MQHLIAFRRTLLERGSVRIGYSGQNLAGMLKYDRSGFFGEEAMVIRQLRELYQADEISVTKFMDGDHSQRANIPVVKAIILSLNGFQMDRRTESKLINFMRRMPPLIVKLAPLNRVGFEDFSSYVRLHHQVIVNEKCDLSAYIDEADEEKERLRRIRVFLACFCLGLIAPYKGGSHGGKAPNQASVLQRVIERIRKI